MRTDKKLYNCWFFNKLKFITFSGVVKQFKNLCVYSFCRLKEMSLKSAFQEIFGCSHQKKTGSQYHFDHSVKPPSLWHSSLEKLKRINIFEVFWLLWDFKAAAPFWLLANNGFIKSRLCLKPFVFLQKEVNQFGF